MEDSQIRTHAAAVFWFVGALCNAERLRRSLPENHTRHLACDLLEIRPGRDEPSQAIASIELLEFGFWLNNAADVALLIPVWFCVSMAMPSLAEHAGHLTYSLDCLSSPQRVRPMCLPPWPVSAQPLPVGLVEATCHNRNCRLRESSPRHIWPFAATLELGCR
jgi:hypothetical protein